MNDQFLLLKYLEKLYGIGKDDMLKYSIKYAYNSNPYFLIKKIIFDRKMGNKIPLFVIEHYKKYNIQKDVLRKIVNFKNKNLNIFLLWEDNIDYRNDGRNYTDYFIFHNGYVDNNKKLFERILLENEYFCLRTETGRSFSFCNISEEAKKELLGQ